MKFPDYVPVAVQKYIAMQLGGDECEPNGWISALASAEQSLQRIQSAIETKARRGEEEYLASLRPQRLVAERHRDAIASNVSCLQRLGHDARMRDVYGAVLEEDQWRKFVSAAWGAQVNFASYRLRIKQATELQEQIANAAEKLAGLISQYGETGITGPGEFYSIPALLKATDNRHDFDRNLHMWRGMREHILGQPRKRLEGGDAIHSESPTTPVRIILTSNASPISEEEQHRNMLQYAWGTAPYLTDLLSTVAVVARNYEPGETGAIGAGISLRMNNPKTDYLRAFLHLLVNEHSLMLNPALLHAIAGTATVVLNQQDIAVTYDDVKKQIPKR
jgi:hypothetical protein